MTLGAQTVQGEVGLQAMAALSARDMAGLKAFLAADAALEWPFAGPKGVTLQGVEAVMRGFGPLAMLETFVLTPTDIYELPEADTVVIEAHSRGTLADGRPDYVNKYVFVLTIVDGRLARWREYFNPIEGAKVFGPPKS